MDPGGDRGASPSAGPRDFREQESLVRSLLANERTFAAWTRTSIAVVVVGLALVRFVSPSTRRPAWFIAIGVLYMLAGLSLNGFAVFHYFRAEEGIRSLRFAEPRRGLVFTSLALAILTVVLILVSLLEMGP